MWGKLPACQNFGKSGKLAAYPTASPVPLATPADVLVGEEFVSSFLG
jgi:hypothetical protein